MSCLYNIAAFHQTLESLRAQFLALPLFHLYLSKLQFNYVTTNMDDEITCVNHTSITSQKKFPTDYVIILPPDRHCKIIETIIQNNLKLHLHIHLIIAKVNQMLGLLKCNLRTPSIHRERESLPQLIQYAHNLNMKLLWCPH